ncbi:hypothetical protein BJF85_22605 [Saccharomonospora sp. CUA-673]|uniref:hypothetical protein n=1 Tax=Saccharomonospora sp. CUA-673 TaxID=1904969 RepID=UPI00095D82B7|nr:hypothetical protein [Saccharomonospora sp. CUA-673]OLT42512.1 hypothetical protein BJF85_22605 [Saccharomonospora sp. CUA-673]
MPIRTNRGRAAVYRRLWGWPMRSPSHLAGTLIVVTALVISIGIVAGRLADPQPTGLAAESTETSRSQADGATGGTGDREAPATRLTAPRETPTAAPADPEALRTAENWANAWVDHEQGMDNEAWLEGLRPYTTDEFLPVMRSVEPDNIPATRVQGRAEAGQSYTRSVEALVATDGPDLSITVIRTDAGWRVSDYSQVG